MDSQAVLFQYMMSLVGTPYIYGGNNPLVGLDCSGLTLMYLVAAGKWPHGLDASSQGIYDKLLVEGATRLQLPSGATLGDIAFYGKSEKEISHVAVCMAWDKMLEAGGGDSTTTTLDAAKQRNAYVRVRPTMYRKDFLCILRPR